MRTEKDKVLITFLVGSPKEYILLNLSHYLQHNIFEYKMVVKCDEVPLVLEQNKYFTKIVNVYIVYDIEAWPKNTTNNLKFETVYLEQLVQ